MYYYCLLPGQWLNDEIINFYTAMLKEKKTQLCEIAKDKGLVRQPSHFFNSFSTIFLKMNKLSTGADYYCKNVKKWRKVFYAADEMQTKTMKKML